MRTNTQEIINISQDYYPPTPNNFNIVVSKLPEKSQNIARRASCKQVGSSFASSKNFQKAPAQQPVPQPASTNERTPASTNYYSSTTGAPASFAAAVSQVAKAKQQVGTGSTTPPGVPSCSKAPHIVTHSKNYINTNQYKQLKQQLSYLQVRKRSFNGKLK